MTKSPSKAWHKKTMARAKALIKAADPGAKMEVKYKTPSNPAGVPVWYHDGMLMTGETFNKHMRFSFAKGPELSGAHKIINTYRAVLVQEGEKLNEAAFKRLVRAAAALNMKKAAAKKTAAKKK